MKKPLLFLVVIFFLSIFLRWYMLPQNLFFGFEQGRDAQIILDIFYKHDFKLVGPKTDLAGIFHGAYYYYLMLPAYVLSHGNPLVASFFLVVVSSLTAIISYFFAKDFFESGKAAALTALLVATSYEYIIYARWLSNVTPAIPFILLALWLLWKYHQQRKSWMFVGAVVAAVFAAQFEIVLVMLFAWVFLCLFVTRILSLPKLKPVILAVVLSCVIFAPHALFNFRNQNIMVKSMIGFVTGSSTENTHSPLNLSANFHALFVSYATSFHRSLSLPNQPAVILVLFCLIVFAVALSAYQRKKGALHRILFLLTWSLMCLPVLIFHDVASLTQLYLGVGFAFIFFFVFALQVLWHQKLKQKPIGKILVVLSVLLMIWGAVTTIHKLQNNDDVFFITIQMGMNYADQQRALQFIHDDAHGQTYRFVAYTIPYLQPEGWQYLQHFLHPQDKTDDGSKLVYIVIEKQVDPFWEKKWTEDLGKSTVSDEKEFGLLRVQKRILQ